MRLVSIFFLLVLLTSCGKQSSSSSSADKGCLNRSCETVVDASDGLGVDLLETIIDVPVKITDGTITFLADKQMSSAGRRIKCTTAVKNGEVYQYSLNGDSLSITTASGSFEYGRLNEGVGLQDNWVWKGYVSGGAYVTKQMIFVDQNRVILKSHCEI